MAIFEVTSDRLVALEQTTFSLQGLSERGDLQRLLRDQAAIIAPDVLIVSEEFGEWADSRRRIDLLGERLQPASLSHHRSCVRSGHGAERGL